MARQPESGRNTSGIARVGKRKWGYNPEQVDEFLERTHALYDSDDAQLTQQDIQNVSFDLSKGGYAISQVDAALGRLERAVVDRQTTREITRHGRVVWKAQTEDLYRSLAAHAERAERQRFRPGDAKAPSYDRKQVDRLVDQVIDKAAAELGVDGVSADDVRNLVDMNSTSVANVIFTQRKGKRGYDERQVDNYLNACVRLLSRIESYARVADYVHDPSATQPHDTAAEPTAAPALFPPREESKPLDAAASPTVIDDDFAELHRVEQQIFAVPAAPVQQQAPVQPPVAPVAPPPATTETPVEATAPVPAVSEPPAAPTQPLFAQTQPVRTEAPESVPQRFDQPAPDAEDSALAGLAHLAASTQEPQQMPESVEPQVPSLDIPSVPAVHPLNLNSMPSLDIPDLSFPTFDNDDQPLQKKPEL